MTFIFRLAVVAALCTWLAGTGLAAGPIDLKEFVKQAFQDQIDGIKSGIYCRASSCDFEVEILLRDRNRPENLCDFSERLA